MGDVFGYKRNPKPQGVFSTEDSKLVFGSTVGNVNDAGEGQLTSLAYLVQQWTVQYQQTVQELFELGSNALFWAKGRPAGAGTLGRVLGGAAADTPNGGFFPADAYDLCKGGAEMELQAKGGHCKEAPSTTGGMTLGKGITIVMNGCVVTSIGFSMQVGDVRLMENFGWRFAYMQLTSD